METFPSEFAGTPKRSVQCQVNAEKAKVLTEKNQWNKFLGTKTCILTSFLKSFYFCNLVSIVFSISWCRFSVASPGAATSAPNKAIPRRTGLGVKTEASAQAIDCLSDKSDKSDRDGLCRLWQSEAVFAIVETDTDHFVFDPKFRQAATAHCCPLSLYPWLSQTLDNIRPDSLLPIIAAVLCCVSICRLRKPWIDSIDRVPEVVERGRINLFPLKEEKAPVKPCPARASPHFV